MRVVFFGTLSPFSAGVFAALIAAGIEVSVVVVPALGAAVSEDAPVRALHPPRRPRRSLPLLNQPRASTVVGAAWSQGIPVLEAGDLNNPAFLSGLRGLRPEAICVACFPRILPAPLLAAPRLGCLNVHPSLLPELRGPAPLFWAFRDGLRATGVSIHLMTERLDRGDIIVREAIAIPTGILGEEMDRRCSRLGGELLVRALRGLAAGDAPRTPQSPGSGSYRGWPRPADFEAPTSWPARRAFTFIRGISDWAEPALVRLGSRRIAVRSAVAFSGAGTLPAPCVPEGGELLVQFAPGTLRIVPRRER